MLGLLVAAAQVRADVEAACQAHGMTMSQYNVLRILRGAPPEGHPRSEIIARMVDRAPDVTRLVDRLVKAGWVDRFACCGDRRVTRHRLTEEGAGKLRDAEPALQAVRKAFAARVAERDRGHLVRICAGLYAE